MTPPPESSAPDEIGVGGLLCPCGALSFVNVRSTRPCVISAKCHSCGRELEVMAAQNDVSGGDA